MELPLTATVLNKRSGITIIGSVGDYHAQVDLTLADQSVVHPNVDENGSFVIDIDWGKAHGDILVKAMLPEHPELTNETILHVQAPEPIVTAVLSTQGIMRKLTGSVNQPGLFIEVHTPENTHPIEVLVDDHLEFELQIPIALRPEDLRVTALNPVTGAQMEVPVEIGVTTKTMTIPILTDDMINSYAAAAEGRRAASEAYDHSLMEKAAASESFVNSIVESITPNEDKRASAENDTAPKEPVLNRPEAVLDLDVVSDDDQVSIPEVNEAEAQGLNSVKPPVLVEQLQPTTMIQVEVLQPHYQVEVESVSEMPIEEPIDVEESEEDVVAIKDQVVALDLDPTEALENESSVVTQPNDVEFSDGDEQVATATGVAEVMHNGGIQMDQKIPEPRPKVTEEPNYSRTSRSQKKRKKGGLIAFLKRIFLRQD
ncbi:hypothetical protein G7084_03195 [Weissella coleopterorum]|uniref:Uncharacterized protein n=1 Tax=Weissella coleopterorum TaxID=2714949 RepID=A0A6G8AZJ3_9LACO|nr:hypothetical protein [Weissella coleopterorum]QIL50407.1 hypothetical protein G7084_03195 [Weissella coleopterorum]